LFSPLEHSYVFEHRVSSERCESSGELADGQPIAGAQGIEDAAARRVRDRGDHGICTHVATIGDLAVTC